ncbi:Heat shock protein GrpE [gamma proteobacterium IMCC1989]|nr:Heat shock protein GrpE [gamma proteobacterium IMCC1989]
MANESEEKVVDPIIENETVVDEGESVNNDDAEVDAEVEIESSDDSIGDVLTEEIASLKEQVLRAHADAQNVRRRSEQDVEKARKFALEKFVADLLPVADNLERAIAAGNPEDETQKAVLEGVELTLKSLQDTLKKHKVEMVDPAGEPFDPQLHQAMTMVPNPDMEPNTVMDVFQKGYTLNGRLVRPAMVVVSSAP